MLDEDSQGYEFLRKGVSGASAKSIAAHLGGIGKQDGSYPHDASDFGRCEALLDMVPEFRERRGEMATVNAYWHALVMDWEGLRQSAPEDRSATMRSILEPIQATDPGFAAIGAGVVHFGQINFSHQDYIAALAAKGGERR